MIINEARFAAAYVTRQGTIRRFDGIGDMLAYHTTHTEDVVVFWVHDYDTTAWLKADAAVFVVSTTLHTPMGHGIVAVSTHTRAEELAATTHGTVTTFAALQTQAGRGQSVSMHHEHHTPHMPLRRNLP
jgi:copper chaperone NosL